jgi:hypothetical protein
MADAEELRQSFSNALRTCGVTNHDVIDAITITQGIGNIDIFAKMKLTGIEQMAISVFKTRRTAAQGQLVITQPALELLRSLHEWTKWQLARGLPIDAALFDANALEWIVARVEFEGRNIGETDPIVLPDKLKNVGNPSWTPFWKQFDTYCSLVRGNYLKLPVAYVYRDHIEVTQDIINKVYEDSDAELMNTVLLEGKYYNDDNKKLWNILKPLVITGGAWPFVKKFDVTKDGRGAIFLLKGQAEGIASITTRRSTAYGILNSTFYTGKNKTTFVHYLERLQFAFSELEECGEEQAESRKADILIRNVTSEKLKDAKSHARSDNEMLNNFAMASEYFVTSLAQSLTEETTANHRNASAASTNPPGTLKLDYTNDEWYKLPKATKEKVIKKRRELKEKQGKTTTGPTSPKMLKRQVEKLTKEVASLNKVKDEDDSDSKPAAIPNPAKKPKKS